MAPACVGLDLAEDGAGADAHGGEADRVRAQRLRDGAFRGAGDQEVDAAGGLQPARRAGVHVPCYELAEFGYFLPGGCRRGSGGSIKWHDRSPFVARRGQATPGPPELLILCAIKVTFGLSKCCTVPRRALFSCASSRSTSSWPLVLNPPSCARPEAARTRPHRQSPHYSARTTLSWPHPAEFRAR